LVGGGGGVCFETKIANPPRTPPPGGFFWLCPSKSVPLRNKPSNPEKTPILGTTGAPNPQPTKKKTKPGGTKKKHKHL